MVSQALADISFTKEWAEKETGLTTVIYQLIFILNEILHNTIHTSITNFSLAKILPTETTHMAINNERDFGFMFDDPFQNSILPFPFISS